MLLQRIQPVASSRCDLGRGRSGVMRLRGCWCPASAAPSDLAMRSPMALRSGSVSPSSSSPMPHSREIGASAESSSSHASEEIRTTAATPFALTILSSLATSAYLWTAPPAMADDEGAFAAALDAVSAGNAGDVAVFLFFASVVALLSVVTLGVVYLGVVQSLDKKQEQEDQQAQNSRLKDMGSSFGSRGGAKPKSGAAAAAAAAAGSAEEEEALAVSRRAAVKKTRDKTKGFGNE